MKKIKGYEHPFHDVTHGEFTWCLHCECAYRTELWVKNDWDCPDKECNGNALDAFPWGCDHWPMNRNPDYPVVPIEGKRYPLYGEK